MAWQPLGRGGAMAAAVTVVVGLLSWQGPAHAAAPTEHRALDFPCRGCVYERAHRRPAPLLVALHGDNQSALTVANLWTKATTPADVALLSLQCPVEDGCPGSFWRWDHHPRWLDEQVEALVSSEGPEAIDASQVFLGAWSGGASYLGARARALSPRWAAIVLIGGGMPPADERCPQRHPPVYFLAGDANPLHPLALDLGRYYERCGFEVTWELLPRADHAGELRAWTARRGALLSWLLRHRQALPLIDAGLPPSTNASSASTTPGTTGTTGTLGTEPPEHQPPTTPPSSSPIPQRLPALQVQPKRSTWLGCTHGPPRRDDTQTRTQTRTLTPGELVVLSLVALFARARRRRAHEVEVR